MSTLKELLNDIPVEWKAMGEVLKIKNGKDYKQFKSGEIPVYGSGGIMTHIDTHVFDKASVLIPRKGSLKNLFFVTEPFWTVDTIFWTDINRKIIEPKFIFYYLKTQNLEELNMAGGVPSLTQSVLNKLPLPIPHPNDPQKSLAIQQEIVRVLDSLSEQNKALTSALANEIDNRKKQYEYYREELFRFEGKEVEWKTLGEVAEKISSGGTPKTGTPEYYDGDIPWLRTQEVGIGDIWDTGVKITELGLKNSSAKMIPENCVIVAMYGATVGKVGINKIPLCTNQACANIQLNKEITHYRYVYYFLLSQYEYIKSLGAGSQTNINAQIVKKLQIPIPFPNDPQKSLAIQQEIVRVLDKFDEATKSIVTELEKEIALRNQQYEYYRNLLLTFPKEN